MKLRKSAITMICAVLCILPNASGCSRINENVTSSVQDDSAGSLSANGEFDDSNYIYSLLTEQEKEYYNILREAAFNFEGTAVFPEKLEPDTLRKLFIAVYYQEEELFWLNSIFYRPTEASDTLKLSYRFTPEEIPAMQAAVDASSAEIFSAFDENTSDYEKLRAFHDYLVLNCTFTKESPYANTIYGALSDGYAQCEGYAFAFDYLCSLADINCFSIMGTNPEGDVHAWNMVELEGMWYHVDCTWDDPILDPIDTEFIRHYYFLVSDTDISGVTHIPDNTYFALPLCTATNNYYKREGLYASDADEGIQMLKTAAESALLSGRKDAAVRFANSRAYESAKSRLFDSREIKEVFAYANASSPRDVLDGKYIRYCNDDELIIHISMMYE